jgi:hypothetical protein
MAYLPELDQKRDEISTYTPYFSYRHPSDELEKKVKLLVIYNHYPDLVSENPDNILKRPCRLEESLQLPHGATREVSPIILYNPEPFG